MIHYAYKVGDCMGIDDILSKYRNEQYSKSDLGTKFEELIARYLMTDPAYASGFDRVYLWKDFFARKELGGHDTGIDLAAKTKTGEYWAIQCKCYAEDHRVSKDDVDTFISASGRRFRDEDGIERSFAVRCIVATTDEWSEHAHGATGNQAIPVVLIGFNILRDARVDWDAIEKGVHGKSARLEKYELRDHQRDALGKAIGHYGKNDRGRMIMGCGTVKTFTSLRIAESFAGGGAMRNGMAAYCSSHLPFL